MSHFAVLVIGDDVAGQLEPYDEGIQIEPYKEHLDSAEIACMASYYGLSPSDVNALHEKIRDWNEPNGGGIDDQGLFVWRTYNPESKWDWWTVGGRWADHFVNKRGEKISSLRKGDLDLALLKKDRIEKAEKWWADALQLSADERAFVYGIDETTTKEAFVARCCNWTPFAVVKDGEWFERGEMGWWTIVKNEKDPAVWNAEFDKLFASLPDDTLLTIVDCHI